MKWLELLALVGEEPVFESAMLFGGEAPPTEVRRQLSRWTKAGRLLQLRRGLYALAPPHGKVRSQPFVVAGRLRRPSYISLESALAYHGLIPEAVPVVTSVTTGRPGTFRTALGSFTFRHVKVGLFWGYEEKRLEGGQSAFVASPEKALIDLIYFTPGPVTPAFVEELRLDPAGGLDRGRLRDLVARTSSVKLRKSVRRAIDLLEAAGSREVTL